MKKLLLLVICAMIFALPLSSDASYWTKKMGREDGLFPDGSFSDVQALSEYSFIAAGTKTEGIVDINFNLLWLSQDGGETLTPIFNAGELTQGLFCMEYLMINALHFFTDTTGLIFGSWGNSYDNCGIMTTSTNYIANTISQGGLWDVVYIEPYRPDSQLTAVDFLDDIHGLVAGGSDNIWLTANGGGSWTYSAFDAPEYSGNATSVSYASSTSMFVVGGGRLIKSNNGGLSWQSVDIETSGSVRDIQFMGDKRGWLLVTGGDDVQMLITQDGGDSWETGEFPIVAGIGSPGSDYTVRDFTMLSRHVGWAVGTDYGNLTETNFQSVIFKTIDGGLTWETDEYVGKGSLNAINMFTAKQGFAVGDQTTVLSFRNPNNVAPIAEAGDAIFAIVDQTITLNGEESFDEDGDLLTYQWSLEEGAEAVALDDATSETPRFTASTQGEYIFALQVFDGIALSPPDRVQIIFDPVPGSDDDADDDTTEPDESDDDEDEEDDGGCCG